MFRMDHLAKKKEKKKETKDMDNLGFEPRAFTIEDKCLIWAHGESHNHKVL